MSNKIINIEVPVYNRNDVFTNYFLKGLKHLTPLKDYVSLSILFNGPNITKEFIQQSINSIEKLGFEYYYNHKIYNENDVNNNNIVQLRDEVHKVNPNSTPLILQLDDDIEILSERYCTTLLACAQFMLENPEAGVICINKTYENFITDQLTPFAATSHRNYTAGGILLKNMPDWQSLYPERAQDLHGSWSDILVSFVRMQEGLGCFLAPCIWFNHYEIRKATNRAPGFTAHQWGKFYKEAKSSVMWLKHEGVGASGVIPKTILNNLWYPKKPFNFADLTLEQIKENIDNIINNPTKILSIEVPSCNRDGALFKYFLKSLDKLLPLKDKIVLCMNYNGGINESDIAAANKIIEDFGFEYYWAHNQYKFEKGKVPTIQFREDAHSLYPNAKYCLLLDDDIEFVSEDYSNELLQAIERLNSNSDLGAVCFCKPLPRDKKEFGKFYPLPEKTHAWMNGGILLKNIKNWNGLFPEELRKYYGTGEDRLCLTVRAQKEYKIESYYSKNVMHWEHHDKNFVPGKNVYHWDNLWNDKNSILGYYNKILGFGQNRWVYINDWYQKKTQVNKRILNIELPVCDKKVFFKRLFLSLKYLKPIAEYCYFVINYQKDFTESNMKMINRYLEKLGFEVISTYSVYNFDKTNHSIVKIRNDTHMLKPDTSFSLLIDSDMRILNETYCKDLIACLQHMINNDNIGVIGLESDSYHWFRKPKNYSKQTIIPTNMSTHIFGTGCGLLIRNIKEWSGYLVPPFLSEKIGRHQDTLTVFERFCLGLQIYSCAIDSATTLKDSNYNRGKYLYGWNKTSNNINSIDSYLKNWLLPDMNKSDLFILEIYPKEPYWENETLNFNFDSYSMLELKLKLDEAII